MPFSLRCILLRLLNNFDGKDSDFFNTLYLLSVAILGHFRAIFVTCSLQSSHIQRFTEIDISEKMQR